MRIYWRLLTVAVAIAATVPAYAQTSTPGSAEVVEQYALTKNRDLAFGAVLPPTAGSNEIVINEDSGARSVTGGGNARVIGASSSLASYTVDGVGGQNFDISVPATMTLTRFGGSETFTVTLVPSDLTGTLSGNSSGAGTASFGVGGRFTVNTGAVIGLYQGTFLVTVENN